MTQLIGQTSHMTLTVKKTSLSQKLDEENQIMVNTSLYITPYIYIILLSLYNTYIQCEIIVFKEISLLFLINFKISHIYLYFLFLVSLLFALSLKFCSFQMLGKLVKKVDLLKWEFFGMFNIALKNTFWYTLLPWTFTQKIILLALCYRQIKWDWGNVFSKSSDVGKVWIKSFYFIYGKTKS